MEHSAAEKPVPGSQAKMSDEQSYQHSSPSTASRTTNDAMKKNQEAEAETEDVKQPALEIQAKLLIEQFLKTAQETSNTMKENQEVGVQAEDVEHSALQTQAKMSNEHSTPLATAQVITNTMAETQEEAGVDTEEVKQPAFETAAKISDEQSATLANAQDNDDTAEENEEEAADSNEDEDSNECAIESSDDDVGGSEWDAIDSDEDSVFGGEWDEDAQPFDQIDVPMSRVDPFGDFCFARLSVSTTTMTTLLVDSNNVRFEEIGGYIRQGVFRFMNLPAELQLKILGYIVEPFRRAGTLQCEIRAGPNHPSRISPYRLVLFPLRQGYTWSDVDRPETRDWLMFNLLRNVTSVSKKLRIDVGSLLWLNCRVWADETASQRMLLDFCLTRPAIWKDIKKLSLIVKGNYAGEEILQFNKFCRFAAQYLELDELLVDLEISYDEFEALMTNAGPKYLYNLKTLNVKESCKFTGCNIVFVDANSVTTVDARSVPSDYESGDPCRDVLEGRVLPVPIATAVALARAVSPGGRCRSGSQ